MESIVKGGRTASGVRVVAGRYRGRRVGTLAGVHVRPTADRVKEALFSILGNRVENACVVDCFAGTGSLGIEALSRGARRVIFVEEDRTVLDLLRGNLARLPEAAGGEVLAGDALSPRTWGAAVFPADVILADPPYHRGLAVRFLEAMAEVSGLRSGGLLVLEHERGIVPAHGAWRPVDRRQYGDTVLSLFEPAGPGEKGGQDAHRNLSGDV
jgi:16S rRNA (guanine(966)-N(2))-methyltransferase RsmD